MPDGEYTPDTVSEDTLFIDPTENTRQGESTFHPQVSPFMAEDDFFELDNKLISELGDIELPAGQIQLLFCEPQGNAKTNPPLLRFGFVTPKDVFNPEDTVISFDSENISGKVRYSKYYHQGRKADYYLATYMPDMYVNPLIQHSFDIQITPQEGLQLQKHVGFDVQSDDNLRVIAANFEADEIKGIFILDKLQVLIQYPALINMDDRLLDPDRWSIEYSEPGFPPAVNSIKRIYDKVYEISFLDEFQISKFVNLYFRPNDGIKSNTFKLKVPERIIKRGGGVVRKVASDLPDCSACQYDDQDREFKLTLHEAHSAIDCETMHYITVYAYCPPSNCSPGIRDGVRYTGYWFWNNYYTADSDNGHGYVYYSPPAGVSTCDGFSQFYDANFDIRAFYEMVAIVVPWEGYCLVDELKPEPNWIELFSDTVIPVIDEGATRFSIEERCQNPPCTDCEKEIAYILTVKATDNNCVIAEPDLLVKFNNGEWRDITPGYSPGQSDPHMFEKRFLIDPNIFACADFLKIIVHDQKGNWSSDKLEDLDVNDSTFMPRKLPYPTKLFLDFDSRLPAGNDQRQYVNLNRQIGEEFEQDVCA